MIPTIGSAIVQRTDQRAGARTDRKVDGAQQSGGTAGALGIGRHRCCRRVDQFIPSSHLGTPPSLAAAGNVGRQGWRRSQT